MHFTVFTKKKKEKEEDGVYSIREGHEKGAERRREASLQYTKGLGPPPVAQHQKRRKPPRSVAAKKKEKNPKPKHTNATQPVCKRSRDVNITVCGGLERDAGRRKGG